MYTLHNSGIEVEPIVDAEAENIENRSKDGKLKSAIHRLHTYTVQYSDDSNATNNTNAISTATIVASPTSTPHTTAGATLNCGRAS